MFVGKKEKTVGHYVLYCLSDGLSQSVGYYHSLCHKYISRFDAAKVVKSANVGKYVCNKKHRRPQNIADGLYN